MKKTILLGNNSFSRNANYYLAALLCFTFCMNGALILIEDDSGIFYQVFAIIQIACGFAYIFYTYIKYNPNSRYSPKVVVTDSEIHHKKGFFSEIEQINFQGIEKIQFGLFKISFIYPNETKVLEYTTSDSASKEIKRTVMEAAKSLGVEVRAG